MRHGTDDELLIDIDTNPQEDPAKNRVTEDPDVFKEMSATLDDHLDEMARCRRGDTGIEDEELIEEHLQELGYLE
jgi:hypothetical protein